MSTTEGQELLWLFVIILSPALEQCLANGWCSVEAYERLNECLLLLLSCSKLLSSFNTLSTSNSLLNHGLGSCNPHLAWIFSSRSLHVETSSHPSGPRLQEEILWCRPHPLHYSLSHHSVCFLHSHRLQILIDIFFACFLFDFPQDGETARPKSCLFLIVYWVPRQCARCGSPSFQMC